MRLVVPGPAFVAGYLDALRRGFSPDTQRPEAAIETIEAIERDRPAYLATLDDRDPVGATVTLRDGSHAPKLPGFVRWMWDGEFSGSIGLRWQPGGAELPAYVPGHVGYAVVPWKQRRGYATAALAAMLVEARTIGLPWIDLHTDVDNEASQRVILSNGGHLLDEGTASEPASRRYRIRL